MDKIILVGDIGSTKSSWWVSGHKEREIKLSGYNPVVQSIDVGQIMINSLSAEMKGIIPSEIWYYGAGVIDDQTTQIIKSLLIGQFPESNLFVKSDLMGAAIATCDYEPGTVAILGTGSHAAVFDGQIITRQANSLGYVLGDEGGGCDIGKSLLQAYFYNDMPENIQIQMSELLPGGRTGLLNHLYYSSAPNKFLASFAKVAITNPDDEWMMQLVRSRFHIFLNKHLLPLSPVEPIHILGSIGCIFADLIKKELSENSLKAGIFLKDPSYRLFKMHLDHGIEND